LCAIKKKSSGDAADPIQRERYPKGGFFLWVIKNESSSDAADPIQRKGYPNG
jgi:hypothetical protein